MALSLDHDRPGSGAPWAGALGLAAPLQGLVEWLARRHEERFGKRVPAELRARLRAYLAAGPVPDPSNRPASHPGARPSDVMWFWLLEELRFVQNALPLAGPSGTLVPVRVTIDRDRLTEMARARSLFNLRQERLTRLHRTYWTRTLRRLRASVARFGPRPRPGRTEVSVVLTTTAERREALGRRLDELRPFLTSSAAELIVVVADPGNCPPGYWTALYGRLSSLECSATLIASRQDRIVTNRNLGTAAATAPLVAFLDDDCRLVGPVLPRLVEAMRAWPEFGLLSPVSYDHDRRVYKPHPYDVRCQLEGDLFVVSRATGMLSIVRRELALVLPFIPFWPNRDENTLLAHQLHRLGFLCGYLMAPDAYLSHEDVERRLTTHPLAGAWLVLAEALRWLLDRRAYQEAGREPVSIHRLRSLVGPDCLSAEDASRLWHEVRGALAQFHASNGRGLPPVPVLETILGSDGVRHVVAYLRRHRVAFRTFVATAYRTTGLCGVNPYLGALRVDLPAAMPRSAVDAGTAVPVGRTAVAEKAAWRR